MKLKVVFAGTPHFAIPSLHALVEHHDVCAVYTKRDSPSGRGLKLMPSPVKEQVLQRYSHIPIVQPGTLKDPESQQKLQHFGADIMVVIAYGLILPKEVLSLFKYGCINVHASLLPRWRGAAPIQRSLLAGDEVTGITIMQINEGLDTGDMLSRQDYVIQPHDTSQTLHDTLSLIGADALLGALHDIISRQSQPIPQDNLLATYAAKIKKEEALINWHESAVTIDRHIRAFNPWPIAHTLFNGNIIKIWEANIASEINSNEIPGKVIGINEQSIEVATEQGSLYITKVQLAGGKPVAVKDFLNARRDQIKLNETILGK
jgi:methionyl-tRNA formyltransferase